MNDSDNEVSGRNEEHCRENIHHLRQWLNCHEAAVDMNMFTRGVSGASQRERRNMLLKNAEKGSMYTVREILP